MGQLPGVRVLLVEDSKDIRDVFTLLLQTEGATVVATGSGREAVEITMDRWSDPELRAWEGDSGNVMAFGWKAEAEQRLCSTRIASSRLAG
jgi:hypothetical protein